MSLFVFRDLTMTVYSNRLLLAGEPSSQDEPLDVRAALPHLRPRHRRRPRAGRRLRLGLIVLEVEELLADLARHGIQPAREVLPAEAPQEFSGHERPMVRHIFPKIIAFFTLFPFLNGRN